MATVTKKGSTFYVVYYYTDLEGNSKQKWEPCGSEEQAEIRKAEIELDKARKSLITPDSITVQEFFEKWIPVHARKRWTYKTYSGSLSLIRNHIYPHIGNIPLQKLTTEHIDLLYDTLRQKEKRTGAACKKQATEVQHEPMTGEVKRKKTLSPTTIKEVHDILKNALDKAVEWKYIRESPIPKDAPKKNTNFEQPIWNKALMDQALHEMTDPILHLAVHCAFIGSLRNGETMGITLDCVDLDYCDEHGELVGRILIEKTLQRVEKKALEVLSTDNLLYVFPTVMAGKKSCLILKYPKTPKSKRFIYLNAELRQEIAEQIKRIEANKEIYGERYNDYKLLFCLPNGNPIEPKLLENWFKAWQKKNGSHYPDLIFHGIRHSSATYKSGISCGDVPLLQKEGGWSTAAMAEHYTHIVDSDRIELSRKMEKDFYSQEPQGGTDLLTMLQDKMMEDPNLRNQILLALLAPQSKN